MKIIVSVILLAFIAISCGTNKKVYAPPFEEGEETEAVVVKENAQATTQTTQKMENTKPVVSREEKVTMTHGDVLKRYNVIVGSFSNETNAINLRNKLNGMGYTSIIMRNENGMNRVSIAGFDEEAPARAELLRVREKYPEYSDAWLLISKK
ncbi:SPOR domain-containing protein [Butyricimonas synergistica]|uniref:SPOR domain-containing protein n=1 Tax=Butyricimonas synergistica TaxID=544644 RepID=UPI0003695622|nr:SPOR domain-containing protein [Butyricimonas synergistica]